MDIGITIEKTGQITFSACPEVILEIALALNPGDASLQERAALLQRPALSESSHDHGHERTDEH